jgi:hypothetical protein
LFRKHNYLCSMHLISYTQNSRPVPCDCAVLFQNGVEGDPLGWCFEPRVSIRSWQLLEHLMDNHLLSISAQLSQALDQCVYAAE